VFGGKDRVIADRVGVRVTVVVRFRVRVTVRVKS